MSSLPSLTKVLAETFSFQRPFLPYCDQWVYTYKQSFGTSRTVHLSSRARYLENRQSVNHRVAEWWGRGILNTSDVTSIASIEDISVIIIGRCWLYPLLASDYAYKTIGLQHVQPVGLSIRPVAYPDCAFVNNHNYSYTVRYIIIVLTCTGKKFKLSVMNPACRPNKFTSVYRLL